MTSTHDIANETKDQVQGLAEHARGAGQEVVSSAGSAASGVADTAKEQASTVASTALGEARGLVGQAGDQVRTQAEEQTRRLAQNLRQMSEQLRKMASQSDADGPARDLVHQAAHHGTRAADFIESRGPSGIVDELQRFARRRPGLFLLGAAAAGAAIGRITRATKDQASSAGGDSATPPHSSSTAQYSGTAQHPSAPQQYPGVRDAAQDIGGTTERDTVTLPDTPAPGSVYGPPETAHEPFGGER